MHAFRSISAFLHPAGSCRARIVAAAAWLVAVCVCAGDLDMSAMQTADGDVRMTFSPQPPIHLSDGFSVCMPDGTELSPATKPGPDIGGDFPAYGAPFSVDYALPPGTPAPDLLLVTFQLCRDDLCFMPETRSVPLAVQDGNSALPDGTESTFPGDSPALPDTPDRFRMAASWDGHATPDQFVDFLGAVRGETPERRADGWRGFLENPAEFQRAHGWGLTVLAILLGGFLLNLTPCVLPMIPVNLAIIGAAASSGAPRRVRFALGLAYGAGMAAAYGGLGAAVVRAGGVFGSALNASPWFAGAMAVLFAALGLAMFGAWHLDFSRWRRAGRLAGRARFPAAVAAGGLSALLAGACVAPVLVAVLALAGGLYAAGQARALLLPFLLGVGMAVPWPLAAAGFAVLPKPGRWMERVEKIFGVLILALALWYAGNAFTLARAAGSHIPEGYGAAPGFAAVDFASPDARTRLDALLADAEESHRPVLLDFGARWCKVCALMETTTLRDARVAGALEGIRAVSIMADDPSSPDTAPLLARYGVRGYPAYRLLLPASPEPGTGK